MTVTVLDDDFAGSSGAIESHTPTTSGGTWGSFGGGLDGAAMNLLGDGTIGKGSTGATYSYRTNSATSTYNDESCLVETVYSTTISSRVMPFIRCNGSGSGYGAMFSASGGTVQLYRANGGSLTTIGSAGSFTASTAPTVGIRVTGTGSTVTVQALSNGSVVASYSDTSASRITALGRPGLAVYDTASTSTGWRPTRILGQNVDPPAVDGITIRADLERVVQRTRGGTTGSKHVHFDYTYATTPPVHIEARLVQRGTNTVVAGLDWMQVVASPSSGTGTFDFAGVPAGQQDYDIQVRFSDRTSVTGTTPNAFCCGDLILDTGQSNSNRRYNTGSSSLTANPWIFVIGLGMGDGQTWQAPTGLMDGPITLGNELIATTGYPVGLVNAAVDGTPSSGWITGASYLNAAIALAQLVSPASGYIAAAYHVQGENDAWTSVTQSTYNTNLTSYASGLRAGTGDTNLPIVIVTLGNQTGYGTDADCEAIRAAQIAVIDAAPTKNLRVDRWDLANGGDNLHLTAVSQQTLAKREARALLKAWGHVSTYRGPRMSSITVIDSTTVDVNLSLDYGTDITAGKSAFRVVSGGTLSGGLISGGTAVTVNNATRQSATVIRLALASSATSPLVSYAYGVLPDATTKVYDNSTLLLPLEWNGGVGPVTGYTLTADSGSYSVTGVAAAFLRGYSLPADAGAYSVSGVAAGLVAARTLTADAGAYSVSGVSANLVYTQVGAYTLTADAGIYSLTGNDAGLVYVPLNNYTLTADAGSYSLAGNDAGLSYSGQPAAQRNAGFEMVDHRPNRRLWWARKPKELDEEEAEEALEEAAETIIEKVAEQVAKKASPKKAKEAVKEAVKPVVEQMPGFDWQSFYRTAYRAAQEADAKNQAAIRAHIARAIEAAERKRIEDDDEDVTLLAMLL